MSEPKQATGYLTIVRENDRFHVAHVDEGRYHIDSNPLRKQEWAQSHGEYCAKKIGVKFDPKRGVGKAIERKRAPLP